MRIGFRSQLWLKDDHFEHLPRMLDEMALEGLDGFEMCYAVLIERYERRPAELRALLAMHGLELASYYTGCAFDTPALWAAEAEEVKRRCRFVAELGSEHVLLDGAAERPGDTPRDLDERIKRIAESANSLGAFARSCGLTLSWHQHWGSIFEVESSFHRLMELTDPVLVRFCPDVGQIALCGWNVVATVRRYADRVGYVHYKDVTFAGRPEGLLWPGGPVVPHDDGAYGVDSRGRWVELGRGVVDFPAVTEALHSVGYEGWIVDDFDFSGYDARAAVRACKQYLNLALGIWGERDLYQGRAGRAGAGPVAAG